MSQFESQIHVGDTVRILERFLPDELSQLRQVHSDADSLNILTAGGDILGGEGIAPAFAATEALLSGLDDVCLKAVLAVRRKLATANLIDLIGKLIAASSFGTLIVVILRANQLADPTNTALVLAIIGLLGTAMPLFVGWLRDGIGGDAGALIDQFSALRDLAFDTRELRARLAAATTPEEQKPIIDAANEIARRAWKLLLNSGYDPRPAAPGHA